MFAQDISGGMGRRPSAEYISGYDIEKSYSVELLTVLPPES